VCVVSVASLSSPGVLLLLHHTFIDKFVLLGTHDAARAGTTCLLQLGLGSSLLKKAGRGYSSRP